METNAARINVEWLFALIWCANRRNLDESKFQMVQLGTQWGETISVKTSHITHIQHDWDFEVWQCSQCVHIIVVISHQTHIHTHNHNHTHVRTHLHSLTHSFAQHSLSTAFCVCGLRFGRRMEKWISIKMQTISGEKWIYDLPLPFEWRMCHTK